MPVEIKELIIRVVATDKENEREDDISGEPALLDQDAIVQECVRQVLRILKRAEER